MTLTPGYGTPTMRNDALRQDGLIGKTDKKYTIGYEDGTFKVNGKAQPDSVKEKYRTLLHVPDNAQGTASELHYSND